MLSMLHPYLNRAFLQQDLNDHFRELVVRCTADAKMKGGEISTSRPCGLDGLYHPVMVGTKDAWLTRPSEARAARPLRALRTAQPAKPLRFGSSASDSMSSPFAREIVKLETCHGHHDNRLSPRMSNSTLAGVGLVESIGFSWAKQFRLRWLGLQLTSGRNKNTNRSAGRDHFHTPYGRSKMVNCQWDICNWGSDVSASLSSCTFGMQLQQPSLPSVFSTQRMSAYRIRPNTSRIRDISILEPPTSVSRAPYSIPQFALQFRHKIDQTR